MSPGHPQIFSVIHWIAWGGMSYIQALHSNWTQFSSPPFSPSRHPPSQVYSVEMQMFRIAQFYCRWKNSLPFWMLNTCGLHVYLCKLLTSTQLELFLCQEIVCRQHIYCYKICLCKMTNQNVTLVIWNMHRNWLIAGCYFVHCIPLLIVLGFSTNTQGIIFFRCDLRNSCWMVMHSTYLSMHHIYGSCYNFKLPHPPKQFSIAKPKYMQSYARHLIVVHRLTILPGNSCSVQLNTYLITTVKLYTLHWNRIHTLDHETDKELWLKRNN